VAGSAVLLILVVLSLGVPPAVLGQQSAATPLRGPELLAALRAGGYILYFRHADTDHGQNDDRMTGVEDCTTQRNLTDRGRDHSRAIGEVIRTLGIPIGAVLASPLCRTVETAMLAFGTAQKAPAAREGGPLPPGSPGRFPALRALLSTPVAPGANTVIVAHAYPYFTLVGGQFLSEGEADVVRPRGGDFEVVARVGLRQWRELAATPAPR
ncbi:MAG TPA: histidine phosphatase family protein, partial [Candidatus Dormibacteraeota bacterium]|nr:histidine phosphatase family protein [Candidatus Dormibacteraeota bacterium]